jgi:hypothetical protein
MSNKVENFFRYLKEKTEIFHHKMSARDHVRGIMNLNYS